ncbi:hypothetical protein RhiLY_08517 [Ceratobasidium sp. AG-Ba]|nr:hypothetical protein RhiLY_08517 [Ceratobasidium sp. AG-Ba]
MLNLQLSTDETLALVRQRYWLGRFKINVSQSSIHPDQRPLDESWVQELSSKIGHKENLNRAQHPIGVILEGTGHEQVLRALAAQNEHMVPDLPTSYRVLVFAGQHRLALLPRLGLVNQEDQWWYADAYSAGLQSENPAEFVTLMHESNVPTMMKASSDVDLFRAVIKLKGFLKTGQVQKPAAVCMLTRNEGLADAILDALSRPHIAKTFQAGSWKRITTGRLWGVASGLVQEMTCQVDLLVKGAVDVPNNVLNLKLRGCQITNLASLTGIKAKRHPWDALPGGFSQALERVRSRPQSFTTPLNPKGIHGWSLPDIVLLPSCLGSVVVEQQLKVMQLVVSHLLRMCADPEHFETYIGSSPETVETSSDHPAGMIAHVLAEKRKDTSKVLGYEQKIIHFAWKNRAALQQALEQAGMKQPVDCGEEDYCHLIAEHECWWELLRMFKTKRLPYGWRLAVPQQFKASTGQASQGSTSVALPVAAADEEMQSVVGPKRPLPEGSDCSLSKKRTQKGSTTDDESVVGQDDGAACTHAPRKRATKKSPVMLPNNTDDETDEELDRSIDPPPPRIGGDRQLGRTLASIEVLAESLTRVESQALSCLLSNILEARKQDRMADLMSVLNTQCLAVVGPINQQAAFATGSGSTALTQDQVGSEEVEEGEGEEDEDTMEED